MPRSRIVDVLVKLDRRARGRVHPVAPALRAKEIGAVCAKLAELELMPAEAARPLELHDVSHERLITRRHPLQEFDVSVVYAPKHLYQHLVSCLPTRSRPS